MAIDSTRTDIKVCSNALTILGSAAISDFTSEANQPAGGVCERLYPTFKKSIYAEHPWKFAMKKLRLTRDSVAPINQWDNQFLFPGDRVENSVYKLFDTDAVNAFSFRRFEIVGERILTNVSQLWADYVHNAPESLWPEDFAEVMEISFAARICIAIKGEDSRDFRNDLLIEAYGDVNTSATAGKWQKVRTSNIIGSPVKLYGDDTLAQARFSGGLFPTPTGGERFDFG